MHDQQSVQAYFAAFMQCVQRAEIREPAIIIDMFLNGMQPDLRAECVVDALGREWSDLAELVTYAGGRQQVLRLRHAE